MASPHHFIPSTDSDLAEMLAAIGVRSFDDLVAGVPEAIRAASALRLPPRLSEYEALDLLRRHARDNAPEAVCFLGAGAYDRIIPAAIDAVIQRSEFTTAYTPYQPEVSQGTLQAIYEFQTMVCELFGMDVANASVYDGASALTEAILLSHAHTGRRKVVFAGPVHPRYRAAFSSITVGIGLESVEAPFFDGGADLAAVAERVSGETACVVVQQPNFYGIIEDITALAKIAHREGALLVISANPVALALLEAPGKQGADVVVGEGQPLGIPLSFGGPGLGLFAVREELKRRLPGRLVGRTVDTRGQQAFVLTLQTREQHIRREKATSNICSNQNLMAIAATMYLTLMGPAGLRTVAENSLQHAHYAADEIEARTAFRRVHTRPFFDEFVVRCPLPAGEVVNRLVPRGIVAGVDLALLGGDPMHLMIAVTEKRTKEEIDALVAALAEIG